MTDKPEINKDHNYRLPAKNEVLIITGMSGAGKSQAAAVLEDMNYFIVDNLPADLFLKFIEGIMVSRGNLDKIAMVIDIRGGEFFGSLRSSLLQLADLGVKYRIIYLEAGNEVLLHRFKETRRRHPLARYNETILASIEQERRLLEELRELSDMVIDTSDMSAKELSRHMISIVSEDSEASMMISLMSFGYKYGLPLDADLVFDVRFLPNPFYLPDLKPLTGIDAPVRDFVLLNDITRVFLDKSGELLSFLLPNYLQEGKKYLSIAIGCTGGQHRSVAISESLGATLKEKGYFCNIFHRDINKSKL